MTIGTKPPAEVTISPPLVRALIQEQHGDLALDHSQLSAVIDFSDLAAGDPATDLSVTWMLLPPSIRSTCRESARGEFDPVDDHTWMRAQGWALALGLVYLAASQDDELMRRLGLATINAALNDEQR